MTIYIIIVTVTLMNVTTCSIIFYTLFSEIKIEKENSRPNPCDPCMYFKYSVWLEVGIFINLCCLVQNFEGKGRKIKIPPQLILTLL